VTKKGAGEEEQKTISGVIRGIQAKVLRTRKRRGRGSAKRIAEGVHRRKKKNGDSGPRQKQSKIAVELVTATTWRQERGGGCKREEQCRPMEARMFGDR